MRTIFPDFKKDTFISSFLVGTFRGILAAFPLALAACSGGSIGLQNQVIPEPIVYSFPACDSLSMQHEYTMRGVITGDGFTGDSKNLFFADQSGRIFCLDAVTLEETGMLHYKKSSVLFKPVISGDMICFARFIIDENESVVTFYDYRRSTEIASHTVAGITLSQLERAHGAIAYLTSKGKRMLFSPSGELLSDQQVVEPGAILAAQSDSIAVFIYPSGRIQVLNEIDGQVTSCDPVKDVSHIGISGSRFFILGREGTCILYQAGASQPVFSGTLGGRPAGIVLIGGDAWMVTYIGSVVRYSSIENRLSEVINISSMNPSGIATLNESLLIVYGLQGDFVVINRINESLDQERFQTGAPIQADPVLREGRIIIGHRNGAVKSYGCE